MAETPKFWHPYAQTWPELTGRERTTMKNDIKKRGVQVPITFRLLEDGTKQYLDGRNRAALCEELGLPCPEEQVEVSDAEASDYIDSMNLHRRHLTTAQRKRQVALMGRAGNSAAVIAKRLNVSESTVKRDRRERKTRVCQNDTPCRVSGVDGKTYNVKKLIPELEKSGVSPKFLRDNIAPLSKPKQRDFWTYLQEMGGDAKKAWQRLSDQREPGEEPPPSRILVRRPDWKKLFKLFKECEGIPWGLVECDDREKNCEEHRGYESHMMAARAALERWRDRWEMAGKQDRRAS